MSKPATRLDVKADVKKSAPVPAAWHPLEDLRREVDRLFEDFNRGGWLRPLRPRALNLDVGPLFRRELAWSTPAVDIIEKDKAFEITAELPGIDAKDITVTLRNGSVVIKGEKEEEKEEKSKDYYLHERQFGSFEQSFLPSGMRVFCRPSD